MTNPLASTWSFAAPALIACLLSAMGWPGRAVAEDAVIGAHAMIVKCAMCEGKGKLVCRPPDHGQYKGAIEAKSHWDVRMDCPFCGGRGRRRAYRTSMPPVRGGPPPCASCGWTGVEKCRTCVGSGAMRCKAGECRNGWNVTRELGTAVRHSSSKKVKVAPCRECRGFGKVICPYCDGLGATLCRKCRGTGQGKER